MTLDNSEAVRVFLFGSYDSRGGTTAMAAPDLETAKGEYARVSWLNDLGYSPAEQCEFVCTAYLGPANLTGDLPVGVEGVDLEWGVVEGAVFCRSTPGADGRDGFDRAHWAEPGIAIELLYVANPQRDNNEIAIPPAGYWYPRWDDDEYGFVLLVAGCTAL